MDGSSAQRLVPCAVAVSTAVLGQSHNVRCTAVEEQPEAKEVRLSQLCVYPEVEALAAERMRTYATQIVIYVLLSF